MTDIVVSLESGGGISDVADDDVSDTTRMLPASSEQEDGSADQDEELRLTTSRTINNEDEEDEGDDMGRDNAVGTEAQNLLNMQNEIARPMSFLGFLRRGNFFLILYFIPVTVSLITVLIVDWESKCNKPLKAWACTQVGIQLVMIIVHIVFLHRLQNPLENERPRPASPLLIINKILNLLWFTWFIVGMVWTFQALADDKCSSTAPYLFRMCFSLMIIQIIILALGVLFCCCSCVVLILRVMVHQRQVAPRGATDDLIRSLPTKRFKDGLVKKDDATCAICLSDYEEDEVVRFLPCGHHYHRNCVDKWLITNKACPFCKHNVDEAPPSSVYSSSPDSPDSSSSAAAAPSDSGNIIVSSDNSSNNNNLEQSSIMLPISPPPEFPISIPDSETNNNTINDNNNDSSSTSISISSIISPSTPPPSVSSSNTDEIV